MPLTPCLTCGALSDRSYCARHRPKRKPHAARGSGPERDRFRRLTLAKTGGRCAIPNCSTPFDGVEAHHLLRVTEGGSNDAQVNGMPLCRTHHRAAERSRPRPPGPPMPPPQEPRVL